MFRKKQAALGFIFITLLIDVIGFGIIIPVLPRLITSLAHCTLSEAGRYGGWLLFSFSLMQFLFSPLMGNLSDRYGRRQVLLLALFGLGVDYLVLAMAPGITWLFFGRVFAGIFGASFTTATAYIADITVPEKRAKNFGMIGVAFGLGFIIGPLLGGLLSPLGIRVPFFVAAGLAFLNGLYGLFILPESLPKENRRHFEWIKANPASALIRMKRFPMVAGLIIAMFFTFLAGQAVQCTWTFFTMSRFSWSERDVGISLCIVGILIAVVQGGLTGVIIKALGTKKSVYLGLLMNILGLLLFSAANASWMMYAFLLPYCLGGVAGPALQSIMSVEVPATEQGELQGTLTSMMSLSTIIGPLLMTNLFSFFSSAGAPVYFPGAAFLMGGLLSIFSLILFIQTLRRPSATTLSGKANDPAGPVPAAGPGLQEA